MGLSLPGLSSRHSACTLVQCTWCGASQSAGQNFWKAISMFGLTMITNHGVSHSRSSASNVAPSRSGVQSTSKPMVHTSLNARTVNAGMRGMKGRETGSSLLYNVWKVQFFSWSATVDRGRGWRLTLNLQLPSFCLCIRCIFLFCFIFAMHAMISYCDCDYNSGFDSTSSAGHEPGVTWHNSRDVEKFSLMMCLLFTASSIDHIVISLDKWLAGRLFLLRFSQLMKMNTLRKGEMTKPGRRSSRIAERQFLTPPRLPILLSHCLITFD